MEKTNLNVAPYYDDFTESKDFHRVLFRPGFAVQARELTQLQSILQNQIEKHGRHVFKEGTVVIPGASGFTNEYYAVKLQSTISGSDISSQIQSYVGKRITGRTSGVVAEVIQAVAATTDDPITLFVKYIQTGTDNVTKVFQNGENIYADGTVGAFGSGVDSATLQTTNATATGSSANIEEGVYFIRGHFVRVAKQRIVLDKYSNAPSYRIGLTITESLETPEEDVSLLDNAQGYSNFNAKGAHRLKFTLTLAKLALTSTDDQNFVELMRVKNGVLDVKVRNTEYSVIGETLARRTFDESGDYTVRDFQLSIRETLNNGLNEGVYNVGVTTDDGNTPSLNYLTLEVAPGKAYVRGFEIETIAPRYLDVQKPRTYENYNAAVTPVEVGNYVVVDNVFGSPEVSPFSSGNLEEPYREIALYDTQNATPGTPNGTQVGIARARAFENFEGAGTSAIIPTTSTFKLYLFDIRMFTSLTMSGTPSPVVTTGAKITGVTSGAYGFVHSSSSGTSLILTSVVGQFTAGEKVKSTSSTETDEILENSSNTDLTISSIQPYDFSYVKQTYLNDAQVGDPDFTADVVLSNSITLSGLVSWTSGTTVSGFQTDFTNELRVGDIVSLPTGAAGALEERRVTAVTNSTTISVASAFSNAVTSVSATRIRAQLTDQNRNILLRKLQKNSIRTLKTDANGGVSDTQVTIRRTFFAQSNASGQINITAGANETFVSVDNTDYVVQIEAAGTGTGVSGDIVNLEASSGITTSGSGTNSLTITSSGVFGNGADVKIIATIFRTTVNEKAKTRNRMHLVRVQNAGVAGGADYGTSAHHKEISLGVADVHRLYGVFDSGSTSTDPVLPQWTITGASGSFTKGELITGATTGAKARVINPVTPITFVSIDNQSFVTGETITGAESGETATLDTFTAGSTDVTNNFTLDSGQRDNFYDIGRIVRKPNTVDPSGRLLIVCDYFSHGAGDFFTVDSYNLIDYADIPTYTATRVDPEVAEPTGEYDLRDTVDFRPRVADTTSTTVTIQGQTTYTPNDFSFNFENRSFAGTGSSTIGIPKDNSTFVYDFEYYLGRKDTLFLDSTGTFRVIAGVPSEAPQEPKAIDNAMKIADIYLNPYVLKTSDVYLTKVNNRRYTMRDIGKLETRINNIEYYTALNLLEKDAQSLQIQDANGLDRFKSGFLVDNFAGHATGDVKHPDYRVAIDMAEGEMRPMYYMKGVELKEENTTDTERTVDQYQKTGDVVTLPYSNVATVDNQYASRVENLNPVLSFSWAGICKLSPSGDEWFEVDRLPDLIINREGNFDTVMAENRNSIGTVWNAWQTQWAGVTNTRTDRFNEHSFERSIQLAGGQFRGRAIIERTVGTQQGVSTRRGVQTSVVAQIDLESQGDRVLSRAMIPFIRPRNISFNATGMKPLTRVYAFFDKVNVSAYCTPTGGSLGGNLVSSAGGRVTGVFSIPNAGGTRENSRVTAGVPRFRTGDRVFRLTSSSTNAVESVETFAQATYSATGIVSTVQETIIATRNARVEVRDVSETANVTRDVTVREDVVGWWDPLAQSFMPQAKGGEYITKIDVYFGAKDANLPVTCQIREMDNGYPTTKVLPFASKTLQPTLDGTVAFTSGSNVITGTGTTFLTDIKVGDYVTVNNIGAVLHDGVYDRVVVVSAVNSDTQFTFSQIIDETGVTAARTSSGQNYSTVNTAPDLGNIKTTFHFDAPVYVKDGVEYCVVLFTDSAKYTAWISRMGELDVGTGRLISEQPYLGVLFKSQNNTTWTAYDMEDLKFTLYRASFDTSKTGIVTFVNEAVPSVQLGNNPVRTFNGISKVLIKHRDHHMYDTDNNVTISGVSSTITSSLNTTLAAAGTSLTLTSSSGWPSSGTVFVKIDNEVMSGTISGTTISSLTRAVEGTDVEHTSGTTVHLYEINGIPLTQINKTHTALVDVGIDYYTVSTSTAGNADGVSGGTNAYASENAQMDVMHTLIPSIEHPGTTLSAKVRTTTGTSPSGSQNSFTKQTSSQAVPIPVTENFYFDNPKLICSQINETNELSGDKSFNLIYTMNTTQENLSPIIDTDRKSIIAVSNRINNIDSSSDVYPTSDYVLPTEPEGDSNEVVYVTRKAQLKLPATSIKCYLDAVQFDTSDIQVMYKILRSDDASDFDEIGWTYFNTNGLPDSTVNTSVNAADFIEREYTANGLEQFVAFAIKIRMQGTNSSEVPRCKDLRAIALAT